MKTLQNTIAIVALATLLLSSNIFAQRSNSASANVTISIYKGLSITNNATSIAFPYTLQGENASLDPKAGEGAKFTIGGSAGRSVTLTYSSSINLTSSDGADLPFTTDLVGNSSDNAATATVPVGDVVTLNSSGDYYIYVGGSVSPDGTHEGDYSGSFTLDIAY